MPILDDIMDHEVIGRERRRGIEIGRQEGRQEGQQEGELKLLCRQIEKRFGAIPASVTETLRGKSAAELEELGLRLLDASSLTELLQ
jgi:flagellar biosynthesis/type III secretory pathway protein FliH